MEDLPKKFGRYELLELIATGGMAHIYRARLTSAPGMTKELVIKRVLPHLTKNRDFIDMFVDEARITMPLNHGNIVQVFEFGQEGDDYFLAMEYVRGRNLETVLTRLGDLGQRMPLAAALYIGSEIAKGLDYAHRFRDPHNRPTGIIHRDVSPQNVLVGFLGEIKLTDFGIAKARSKIHQTSQGIIRGKAVYLSPEQAECEEVDGRSDQFSLGSVLYEMLAGIRPFEGETEVATLQKVRRAQVPPPSKHREDLPPSVDAAVLKTLAHDPGRRFASCGALQLALSRSLAEHAPDFTSADLADWISGLFEAEITHEITARTTRERLLEQLAGQGDQSDRAGRKLTTGEMLQMGTVDIQATPAPAPAPPRRRWPLGVALGIVLLLAATALGAWLGWPWAGNGQPPDAGPTDASGQDAGPSPDAAVVASGDPAAPDAGPQESDAAPGPDAPSEAVDAGSPEPGADPGAVAPTDATRPKPRWAYLNLNARPWALVELDGKRLDKETPLFKVRVRAGRHRLRFFNPALKIEKVEFVTVRPGQERTISVELTP